MSNKLKIMIIASICFWLIGSYLIYTDTNGKSVSISSAVIIIAGLYFQIIKERKENQKVAKK